MVNSRKSIWIYICALILFSGLCHLATAQVLCPRIISEHNADVSDLRRFSQFPAWRDKTGNDRALSIWRYLCDYETGLYHFNEILEGHDSFDEYATVRDPLKILNVYNMAYCGIFGPVLDGIYQGTGFTKGRAFGVSKWNHCTTEVWYDDSWHYLDLDVRGALLDDDGIVVSLDQARRQRSLWTNPPVAVSPFFPKDHDKNRLFEIYRDSQINYFYRWFEGSHTMDYYLRPGETFTRWWRGQGGRWHHLLRYNKTPWLKNLIRSEPVGMKPNHRDFTCWNHGNGLFHYQPDLTDAAGDFDAGVLSSSNLIPGRRGLHFKHGGSAEAVFELFTPYVIVAKINDLDDETDDSEASIITLETFLAVDLLISLDHGLTWQPVATITPGKKQTFDLTRHVKGTYGYRLKLTAQGNRSAPAVKSLAIDTWVQVAPISLPRLKKGVNRLRYEIGDRYGLFTTPMLITPNTDDPDDLKKYLLAMPADYDPSRKTERIRGEAILRLKAPPGRKIAWFSIGACFRTYQGAAARNTDNRIAYAAGEPKDFCEIYRASVPQWVNHWRYNWDGDVVLEKPAETVYVKYTGKPAINTIRACLHLTSPRPTRKQLQITHGYRTDGKLQQKQIDLTAPANYTVICESQAENVFVTMFVPSISK